MQVQTPIFRPAAVTAPIATPLRRRADIALGELIGSYGARGGLASTDEVIGLMRPYWRQPISVLAKWIVGRKVVSFTWRTQILLPAFQFERPRMTPHQGVADCSLALADVMGEEALAAWFVSPCRWLGQKMPVDTLLDDPDAVVDAAARTRLELIDVRGSRRALPAAPSRTS
jgi:hypothetical protein